MKQATGGQFELTNSLTKLIFNGFWRNMEPPGDFLYGQSLFTAILKNQPASDRQVFHFLLYPFDYGLIMQDCFYLAVRHRDFRHTAGMFFTVPDSPFHAVQDRIFHGYSEVIFSVIYMSNVPVGPECGKHIMYDIFCGRLFTKTVISDYI